MRHLPFFIAQRSFRTRKGNFSAVIIRLSVIATAISVAVMLLSLAFISGFKYEIREKLFSFWGHILVTNYAVNASNLITTTPVRYDPDFIKQVGSLPQVKQVVPFIVRPGILHVPGAMEGISLKGIAKTYRFADKITFSGDPIVFPDSTYAREIILSASTAARLHLQPGDTAQLYFIEPGSMTPRIRKVTIPAIFHTGMEEVDKNYALCDIRLLQRINNWQPDEINGYQVDLDDAAQMDALSAHIFDAYTQPPLYTYTMREVYGNIFDWLQLQDLNARIVLIIMAAVAIINLAVALMILIVEQARLVGLLKALGMKLRDMMQVFLYYALVIAAAGIAAGNALAGIIYLLQLKTGFLKLDEATYYMKEVPVRLYWWHVVVIDLATLVLCVLCMLLPALYIRRIQPAKVLQFR